MKAASYKRNVIVSTVDGKAHPKRKKYSVTPALFQLFLFTRFYNVIKFIQYCLLIIHLENI